MERVLALECAKRAGLPPRRVRVEQLSLVVDHYARRREHRRVRTRVVVGLRLVRVHVRTRDVLEAGARRFFVLRLPQPYVLHTVEHIRNTAKIGKI